MKALDDTVMWNWRRIGKAEAEEHDEKLDRHK